MNMSPTNIDLRDTPFPVGDPLNDLLVDLDRYGEISLFRMQFADKGWFCQVTLRTEIAGTRITVRSEYNHPSPLDAASLCHSRMKDAILKLNGGGV